MKEITKEEALGLWRSYCEFKYRYREMFGYQLDESFQGISYDLTSLIFRQGDMTYKEMLAISDTYVNLRSKNET